MENRKLYLQIISKVEDLVSNLSISQSVNKDLSNLKDEITDFRVIIPVVGGFSAGKTSLINSYFSTKFKTDLLPETAIATELHYSQKEKIRAYSINGKFEEYSIEELDTIDCRKYSFLQVYLNNNKIKELNDITVVDMPGLDSNIEQHNKAIFNYINEASHYILVSDIDHGIKESVLNFLNEINTYNIGCSIILSKTDHKLDEDVQDIFNNTRSNIDAFWGKEVFLGKTSTKTNEIEDFEYILKNINVDLIIKYKFKNRILNILENIISELTVLRKCNKIDTDELEKRIFEIQRGLKEIDFKINEEEIKIQNELQGEVKNNIIRDLKNELNNNIYTLSQAIKNGNEFFTQSVNEIIRPILNKSTNENLAFVFEESIVNINKSSNDILQLSELINVEGENILDAFLRTINLLNNEKINKRYKYLGGLLAITTDIVAPWMEIILLALPEILKIFSAGSEKREDERIRLKIEQEVIPNIIRKLRPDIEKHLELVKKEFIHNVKTQMEENKNRMIESLENVIKEKELKESEFMEENNKIESIIEELKIQKSKLEE